MTPKELLHGASHLFANFVIQYSAEDIKYPCQIPVQIAGAEPRSPLS